MNAKTAKKLRRVTGYKPSEHTTSYARAKGSPDIIVNPTSPRGKYRAAKKHYKEALNEN